MPGASVACTHNTQSALGCPALLRQKYCTVRLAPLWLDASVSEPGVAHQRVSRLQLFSMAYLCRSKADIGCHTSQMLLQSHVSTPAEHGDLIYIPDSVAFSTAARAAMQPSRLNADDYKEQCHHWTRTCNYEQEHTVRTLFGPRPEWSGVPQHFTQNSQMTQAPNLLLPHRFGSWHLWLQHASQPVQHPCEPSAPSSSATKVSVSTRVLRNDVSIYR